MWQKAIRTNDVTSFHAVMFGKLPWDNVQPDINTSALLRKLAADIDAVAKLDGRNITWTDTLYDGRLQYLRQLQPDYLQNVLNYHSSADYNKEHDNAALAGGDEQLYRCDECEQLHGIVTEYTCPDQLRMHRVSLHGYRCKYRSVIFKAECPHCNRKFNTETGLETARKHFRTVCGPKLSDEQLAVYRTVAERWKQANLPDDHDKRNSTAPTLQLTRLTRPAEHIDMLFAMQAADQAHA